MDGGFFIRQVKLGDLRKICEIEEKSFPYPWSILSFLYVYHESPKFFFVAVKDGKVVGYIILKVRENVWKSGHLLNLAVDPKYRRRGIGRALLKYALEILKKESVKNVWLEVRASNNPAINLYLSLGFVKIRKVSKYYPDGEDAIIMMKRL